MRKTLIILYSLVAIMISCELLMTNLLSTKGGDLSFLITKSQALTKENDYYKSKIASKKALVNVRAQAVQAGFCQPGQVITIKSLNLLAKN